MASEIMELKKIIENERQNIKNLEEQNSKWKTQVEEQTTDEETRTRKKKK